MSNLTHFTTFCRNIEKNVAKSDHDKLREIAWFWIGKVDMPQIEYDECVQFLNEKFPK
jgi:hypothetical protein